MSRPALYVRLLGEPEVESGSGRHVFLADKRYLLLAFLACQPDRVDRARLARLFWPNHDPPAARHNLRQLLKRLSSLPFEPLVESGTGPSGPWLRWLPSTDLADLEVALQAGDWTRAMSLHRGPLLASVRPAAEPSIDTWLESQRSELEERLRREFMGRCTQRLDAGDYAAAADMAGHVLDGEPYDEEALRAYMEAIAATGQPAKALTAYERFAAQVVAEFGLKPTSTTESLAGLIRNGHGRAGPRVRGAKALESRDLDGGGVADLVGRELELGDVHRLFANHACRLVTVTGPGGVGKSALVRRAARELGAEYDDGYVFVVMDGGGGASDLRQAIATRLSSALGISTIPDPAVAIGSRHLLLVLDDLDDHHAEAELLLELLTRCRNLSILATTRERLGVEGEWLLTLEGLRSPARDATHAEIVANDAVTLFVDHARRVRTDYYLTEGEAHEVARICRLVAGLPLAIELAAAWTRALPAASIAEEIATGIDLLSGGPRGRRDRHTSMRACIEHSWNGLSERQRSAWRSLSVFESPFGRAAAARVAEVALPQLAELVDKSVLWSSATGSFSFHPLLHAFGVERLLAEPFERAALREVHARHFLAKITEAHEQRGSARREAVGGLERRLEDVAAAWRWALAAHTGRVVASRAPAFGALERYSLALSDICEGRGWHAFAAGLFGQAAESLADSTVVPELLGALQALRGWHELKMGWVVAADGHATEALALLVDHDTRPAWRRALVTLAGVAIQDGRYADAETHYSRAIASVAAGPEANSAEAKRELASFIGNLGLVRQLCGDRSGAAKVYQRQLHLVRELGDKAGLVTVLDNLGNVLRLMGRPDDAMAALQESLRLATTERQDGSLTYININLGVLHLQTGAPDEARRCFEIAATMARESGQLPLVINAATQLGRLDLDHGTVADAERRFFDALELAVESENTTGTLNALAGCAWVAWRTGARANAVALASTVRDHPATVPGTRTWARELLDLAGRSARGDGTEAEAVSFYDGVIRALALVAG